MSEKVSYKAIVTFTDPPFNLYNWEIRDTYTNILKWVRQQYAEGADAVELELKE
jgi:hypothetical protein|tara:strand:- start:59 stop:220 length:162 start_codon:yes stop_codon:yes gene_type:complete